MMAEDGTPWTEAQVKAQIIEDTGNKYQRNRGGAEFYAPPNRAKMIGIHTLVKNYS